MDLPAQAFKILGGCETCDFLKHRIECGLGVESAIKGNGQEGVILEFGVYNPVHEHFNPKLINVGVKILAHDGVERLGQMMPGNLHFCGNLSEC